MRGDSVRGVSLSDHERLSHDYGPDARALLVLDARPLDQIAPAPAAPIERRGLGALEKDLEVVDAENCQRSQEVFDRSHLGVALPENRFPGRAGDTVHSGFQKRLTVEGRCAETPVLFRAAQA